MLSVLKPAGRWLDAFGIPALYQVHGFGSEWLATGRAAFRLLSVKDASPLQRLHKIFHVWFMACTARFSRGFCGLSSCPCGLGQAKLKADPARDDLAASKTAVRRHLLELF